MSASDNSTPFRPGLWGRFRLAVLVPLARLRFLVILGVIGLAITKRDLLVAWYEKYARPADAGDAAAADVESYCPMHPAIVRDDNAILGANP